VDSKSKTDVAVVYEQQDPCERVGWKGACLGTVSCVKSKLARVCGLWNTALLIHGLSVVKMNERNTYRIIDDFQVCIQETVTHCPLMINLHHDHAPG
jgi:hypothetical protein